MEIIIIGIILVLLATFLIYRKRLISKGQGLSIMVEKAMSEFQAISNHGRQASDDEIQTYKTKYADLSEKIRKLRFTKLMTQNLFDSFSIGEYMVFYATIYKYYQENNRINNEIQKLNSWCDNALVEADRLLEDNHYFAFSESKSFLQQYTFEIINFKKLFPENSKYFSNQRASELYNFIMNMQEQRMQHN